MKKPLPIGISDFKKLIEGGYAYVDKTLLIQELIAKEFERHQYLLKGKILSPEEKKKYLSIHKKVYIN